ncbi:MAG: alpha/beta hydrolase [Cyanobacteria bacterium P01_F01_bin.150]
MIWISLIGGVLGVLAVVGALLFLLQRRLLYPGPYLPISKRPGPLPDTVEKFEYDQGYGLFINAAAHLQDQRPLLIYVHGNAETALLWSGAFDPIVNAGISVLLLEYPGYAGAKGKPSYQSIKAAVLESYDHIVTRSDVDASAIVAYGRSMGGGAVSLLADHRPLAALCLECTFASLRQLVAEKRIPGFLLRDRYENAKILARLKIPTFIYHGSDDTLIPIRHSHQLKAAAADNATCVTGSFGHNNCPRPWTEVLAFLEEKTAIAIKKH